VIAHDVELIDAGLGAEEARAFAGLCVPKKETFRLSAMTLIVTLVPTGMPWTLWRRRL
jgi:hypothetical protein